jgi:hypothetical protein
MFYSLSLTVGLEATYSRRVREQVDMKSKHQWLTCQFGAIASEGTRFYRKCDMY